MKTPLILASLFLVACASQRSQNNDPKVIEKAKSFVSPNQLATADMYIFEDLKSDKDFSPDIYVGKGELRPSAVVPQHVHPESDEILIFSQAGGELIIGGKVYKIQKDHAYFIPRGTKHSYSNRGEYTAKFVQIYSPAGPEKKFLKWAPK